MESGNIVEYIDRQKIICAVVLEVKKQRLSLLTENNREVNLSQSRLSHKCNLRLELSMGKNRIVDKLNEIVKQRKALSANVDVKELWEVLNGEQEWIDLETMTALCFPNSPTYDHESAVIRALFENRLFFKFDQNSFSPISEELLQHKVAQQQEAAHRSRIIAEGSDWLTNILVGNQAGLLQDKSEIKTILKSYYVFEKESEHYNIGKAILTGAGIDAAEGLFKILVKLGVFDENENIDLYRYNVPTVFSDEVTERATRLINIKSSVFAGNSRKDLTMLPIMTIDGQGTLDYDDAISIEDKGDHYRLGVHIVDVGHYIKKGDVIDREAFARGSSIYMSDQKIPMLPANLAEDLCSLRAGELRPAVSIMANISRSFEISDYEIFASIIRVQDQFTYYDVNLMAADNNRIIILRDVAESFRQQRFDGGAVQINLPDIHVWIDENGEVMVSHINRESPGRMLVAEIMIMANWLMAKFLKANNVPAVYRTQNAPKERLYKGNEGTIFENYMQRRFLSRFVLNHRPEHHSGLGLNAYVTATSPIRKYFDLATQRQIRAVLGLEEPYTKEEIAHIIQMLGQPMSDVSRIQYSRNRYWLLKYLEKRIGQKEEAIVLFKRRDNYRILLTEYVLECDLAQSSGISLKPEDLIQVTLQHADARKDVVSVFMG